MRKNTKSLNAAYRTITIFRRLNEQVHANTIGVFLLIAQRPGVSSADIAERMGISLASVSRCINTLAKGRGGLRGTSGMGLVHIASDPQDGRRALYNLTPRGQALAVEVAEVFEQAVEQTNGDAT